MKKMNNKGFTLIELLAVITIMGILMMVAIPSVSRTIENSRRDTFASTAHEYVNAVRNAVLADNIECNIGTAATPKWVAASATPDGTYFFTINTASSAYATSTKTTGDGGTLDLMESGGKSSFGNADMFGYIKWVKATDNSKPENPKTTVKYSLWIQDTGKHGMNAEAGESAVKRSNISTNVTSVATYRPGTFNASGAATSNEVECKIA